MDITGFLKLVIEQMIIYTKTNKILAYVILGLSAFIENIFPPAPGDTVVVFGGFLVAQSDLSFTWVLISTTIGGVLGFMGLFYIGYHFGRDFIIKKNWKLFNIEHVNQANTWFVKYGYLVIIANRFLSGLRSIISITAGITKMDPKVVLVLSTISFIIWNGLLTYLGYVFGQNWQDIVQYIEKYSQIVFFIILGVIIFIVAKKLIQRKKA